MRDPLQRLYQTKLALLAVIFVVVGAALLVVVHWPDLLPAWTSGLPLTDLGSALFTTGLVVIAFEYVDGRDSEERADARLRATIRSEAPAIREAVIRGFAVETDDLKRVATPQLLDQIAENSIGLRFGGHQFASEVYGDIRHQAINAEERWYDARVQIDIGDPVKSSAASVPTFDVTVRWQYRVVPHHRFRRFVVVGDRRRYDELSTYSGETSAWFKSPISGLPLSDPATFRLLQFTLDGEERQIDRHVDDGSQTYSVDVGAEAVAAGEPVVISFTYVTRTVKDGHVLRFDVDRPTRGLEVELNYEGCGISRMRMFDYVSRAGAARTFPEVPASNGRQLRFAYDGWLFPRSGLIFTWTLDSERLVPARADDNARHTVRRDGRR
ncbi:hypothetical protein [Kribbella sp. NPDC051620]|uniref:hypothetical protein n=1 Tax=Kribbella sp. NPDC051620 TaxID=3364120 RepID=UPI0037BD779C